jgi:hypothetical protein
LKTKNVVKINKLSWHLVWIIACLEGITVAILPYVSNIRTEEKITKPPESGLLLGYIGMLAVILLINIFSKNIFPNFFLNKHLKIRKPFLISIWGSVYLSLIFLFQSIFSFPQYSFITIIIRAVCSLSFSTFIVLLLYQNLNKIFPWLSMSFSSGEETYRILGIAILPAVVVISLYEAIALPIIEFIRIFENYRWLAGLSLGLISGAFATTIIILVYNSLSNKLSWLKAAIVLEKSISK